MGLFQNSVLNKYYKTLDQNAIDKAFELYSNHFLNPSMQTEIRSMKEEEYQDGFLDDLFVNVLGYVKRPKEGYNLIREKKNETDGKKADGAILKGEEIAAVIELKGTDTTDIGSITSQAFGYKNNHSNCIYVITSNFEKLRFYIQNAVEFLEFNLFNLSKDEFKLLWLCLQADNILGDLPLKVKEESVIAEEDITKKLYKDYSLFKHELWQNICKNSPELDKLLLFKRTQKLLDRFLFIFFAEDSGLLPPNSITRMVERYEQLIELDAEKPLYDIFKQYFGYINTGRKGKVPQDDIFEYNGGLFFKDKILDNVSIDDDLLKRHILKLTTYDFSSEVDVNILGHIFENSLNEIENVTAILEGQEIDKSKTKRKKDGVFYTPKYITKYIVDNTIGKLCEEKKKELGVVDEEYAKGRRNRKKDTIKKLDQALQSYREWLLNITICDPACGSGAFLNQALEFLIDEHAFIDELYAQLMGASIVFQDVSNHILEKNIYGVDINEESVDIAKLSLWLRTAQRGRKLTSLNNNIKCGNSIIDNPEVAGDKAFNWHNEFPEVFSNGGFDVIIGNPPYVRVEFIPEKQVQFYKAKYESSTGKFDLSSVFYEKSMDLLNDTGIYSIITSYQFIYTSSGIGLRKFIAENAKTEIVMFSSDSQVFGGATTYAGIFLSRKIKVPSIIIFKANNEFSQVNITESFNLEIDNFTSDKVIVADTSLLNKIESLPNVKLGKELGKAKTGVVTSADEVFYLTQKLISELSLERDLIYPILGPNELQKWHLTYPETFCLYPYTEINGKTTLIEIEILKSKFPNIFKYLLSKKDLLQRRSQGRKDYSKSSKWYQLNRPREKWIYDSIKIIYPGTTNTTKFAIDTNRQLFRNARVYAYLLNEEDIDLYHIILPILNSSLCKYMISLKCPPKANNYYEMSTGFMENFPFVIPKYPSNFISKSTLCEDIKEKLTLLFNTFLNLLINKFDNLLLSKKLENWYELEFSEFFRELEKARKKTAKECETEYNKLSLAEEAEWMHYFNEQKQKAQELKQQIDQTEREIDQMVYELYGLTEEEIKIVENS